jgi:serine/threonine-protein kinase ATR
MLLGNQHVTDLEGLSKIAPQCYQERSEEDRRLAIRLLGWLPCSFSTTTFTVIEQDHGGAILSAECAVCDATETVMEPSKLLEPGDQVACQLAREVLESLHQVEEFQESQNARIYAMGTLRRLLVHMSPFWPYQFAEPLGVWCLQSLQSSKTALRIAAGRTLPAFMAQDDATITEANWHDFVQYAKDISPKVPLHHEQTWAMAWGQLARTLSDDKLSLCLCRLVDYLGHPKQIVCQAAFTEILFAAEARRMKVEEMFTPFWRHIAHPAVKDLHNKPQTAQAMADLLGINLNVFLVKTQAHTLPWLVLSQDHIIITRISQARGDETVVKAILENVAPIMAVLLRQQVPDHEKYIMDLLGKISPKFHGHDLVDVLKMDAIGIALELLRAAGEADDSQRSQVRNSLRVLAEHCVQVVDRKKRSKVATFLKQYCLGLVAYFSDVLNDARSSQTHLDKIRSLRGLEEMLKIGRIHVAGAIPQVR